jgi:hypothetical protein
MTSAYLWGYSKRNALARLTREQRHAVARAEAERTLARLRAWDEGKHPRDPAGTSTGGQFTSSGGGAAATDKPAEKPADKKKNPPKSAADFAADDVALDESTRTNPDKQKKFIDTWNRHVGDDPAEFRNEFLGGLKSTMTITYYEASGDSAGSMEIRGKLLDDAGNTIGTYTRDIDFDRSTAESSYFAINRGHTDKGTGKTLLKANVDYYQKIGLDKLKVHANIDVGGYAWAKYGYVPTDDSWGSLGQQIEEKINQMSSGGGGGYAAESWDEMSETQQSRGESAWMRITEDEMYDYEVESWRENGQPLEEAKKELAEEFDGKPDSDKSEWVMSGIEAYRAKREKAGKPAIPFTDEQILASITVDYQSRNDDGNGDLDVAFDDSNLTEPQGYDPNQQTLPGIEPIEPHEHLTEEMRDGLIKEIDKSFDRVSDSKASDIEPPDYLRDNLAENQRDHWESMGEADRYEWLKRHAPEVIGETEESQGTGEIDDEDADTLRELAQSSDPKALWQIADSQWGKQLLLGTDWYGAIDFNDKETMERFNAYVGKGKAKAA